MAVRYRITAGTSTNLRRSLVPYAFLEARESRGMNRHSCGRKRRLGIATRFQPPSPAGPDLLHCTLRWIRRFTSGGPQPHRGSPSNGAPGSPLGMPVGAAGEQALLSGRGRARQEPVLPAQAAGYRLGNPLHRMACDLSPESLPPDLTVRAWSVIVNNL